MTMHKMVSGLNDLMMLEAVIPIIANLQWDASQLT